MKLFPSQWRRKRHGDNSFSKSLKVFKISDSAAETDTRRAPHFTQHMWLNWNSFLMLIRPPGDSYVCVFTLMVSNPVNPPKWNYLWRRCQEGRRHKQENDLCPIKQKHQGHIVKSFTSRLCVCVCFRPWELKRHFQIVDFSPSFFVGLFDC